MPETDLIREEVHAARGRSTSSSCGASTIKDRPHRGRLVSAIEAEQLRGAHLPDRHPDRFAHAFDIIGAAANLASWPGTAHDEEHPLYLDAVVHETAPRTPAARPAVPLGQLRHLTLINELPTVSLRILPTSIFTFEAAYGGFDILDFPLPGQPSSLALAPDESVTLIERVADELWSR